MYTKFTCQAEFSNSVKTEYSEKSLFKKLIIPRICKGVTFIFLIALSQFAQGQSVNTPYLYSGNNPICTTSGQVANLGMGSSNLYYNGQYPTSSTTYWEYSTDNINWTSIASNTNPYPANQPGYYRNRVDANYQFSTTSYYYQYYDCGYYQYYDCGYYYYYDCNCYYDWGVRYCDRCYYYQYQTCSYYVNQTCYQYVPYTNYYNESHSWYSNAYQVTAANPTLNGFSSSNPSSVCILNIGTTTVSFSSTGGNYDNLAWSVPSWMTIVSGQGTSTITVSINNGQVNGSATGSITATPKISTCSGSARSFNFTANALPSASSVKTNVTCPGGNDGSITITGSGGKAPYQYSINGGSTYSPSSTFGGLGVGTYSLYIKDANSCPSAIGSVTISQVDAINPTIICQADITMSASSPAGAIVNYVTPVASDNCSATTTLTAGFASGAVFPIGNTTVTYKATDASGNSAECSFNVNISGLAPSIVCPSEAITATNEEGKCEAAVSFAATETTGIPASTISYTENGNPVTSGSSFTVGTHTIEAIAINPVGRSTCSFTITVLDTQSPVLTGVPENITVECDGIPAPATVTASDNCSTSVPSFTETRTDGDCPSRYTLTRTWSTTDASNNTTTATQVITVQDTKAPVLSAAPEDVTVECDAVPEAATLTATDNCDAEPVVTYGEVRKDGDCPNSYTLTRTWTAVDACGNTSSKTQVITVQDKTAPILSAAPVDVTVECDAVPVAAVLTATDNCSTPTVTYTETRADGSCPNSYTLTRTWTATDACGNTSGKTQVITVQDTKAPKLSIAPGDITVECDEVPAAAVLTATDNCDAAPVVSYNETRTNGTSVNNYTLTRVWTAKDACGNTFSKTQVISVRDTKVPVFVTVPGNFNVNTDNNVCGAVINFAATATDVCGPVTITYSQNPGTVFATGTTTVVVTASDPSGNTTVSSFTVTVTDHQAPTVVTKNITVNLDGLGKATITGSDVDNGSSDACGIRSVTVSPNMFSCSNIGNNTVTLTVTDVNGNVSTKTAVVTVQDKLGPVPTTALPTINGQCSVKILLANNWSGYYDEDDYEGYYLMNVPTALDNCSGLIRGTTTDKLNYYVQGTYTIHWKFTDRNGNTTIQEQTVVVNDNQAPKPYLTQLPTITGQCSVDISSDNDNDDGDYDEDNGDDHEGDDNHDHYNRHHCGAPWAWDNCAGWIKGTTGDPLSYTIQGTYVIHWTFNDGHGNITTQNQTVIVKDVTAPKAVVSNLPTVSGQCSASVTAKPTAKDNCAGIITGTTTSPLTYSAQGTYTIVWTYTDGHGNTSTQNQTVIVKDNTKPVISDVTDKIVNCGTSTDPSVTGTPTATDNCGSVTVSKADVTNGNVITRTWKATDAAGNYSTSVQMITIGAVFTATVSSAPTSNVYTGGVNTNLYIGYGAQSTVLQLGSLPSGGAPYTYAWTGTNTSCLSSTSTASPVFTPTAGGYSTFTVTVTNKYNCKSTATISICVTDVRVAGTSGSKINICHNGQTLQVSVNAVSSHIGNHNSDRLGSCDQSPCNSGISMSNTSIITSITKQAETTIATTEEELKVTVMPNPSSTYFTLKLESRYETPVSMRVMDAQGRVVDSKSQIGANSTIQIGHNYSGGTYFAEMIQGTKRKVVQLIKEK